MGLENLLMKTEGSTLFYFCVSLLSSLKNLMLLLLHRAVKINYLTYTKYYECAPCNFLINQNVSSFNLGQCTVFRGYWVHYTHIMTDHETSVFLFPQTIPWIFPGLVTPSLSNLTRIMFTLLVAPLSLAHQSGLSKFQDCGLWLRNTCAKHLLLP